CAQHRLWPSFRQLLYLDEIPGAPSMTLLVDVLEFEHFITFVVEEGGELISVQYHADQTWKNEDRVWHVARDAVPIHVSRKPAPPAKGKSSGGLMDTLAGTLAYDRR